MTANTSDVYSGNIRPDNSDEIDLRRYLLVVLKWWREILLITLIAGGFTALTLILVNKGEPPTYTAHTDILIARFLSDIELDARIITSVGGVQNDQNAWRASLLQTVKSSEVATAVFEELQDELPADYQSPSSLISTIDAEVPMSPDDRFASNIIRITANTTAPEISALIANSWAQHFVDYINGLYGEVPESMITNVSAELDEAMLAHQMAEKELEEFVANNQIDPLTRQITEKSTLRNEIMLNYTKLLTSVVSSEYSARIGLYGALVAAPANYAAALAQAQSRGNVETLDSLYRLLASATAQLNQAQLMERSLEEGGEAAAKSNVVPLQLLKMTTFATLHNEESFPAIYTPSNSAEAVEMTLEEQLTDVRALVSVLQAYVTQLETDIQQLAQSAMPGADLMAIGGMANGLNVTGVTTQSTDIAAAYAQLLLPEGELAQSPIDIGSTVKDAHEQLLATLETDIRTLQSALVAEQAKQRQLEHQRDLTWTTYDAVGSKLQELNLLRSSANTELRMGTQALVPSSPQPRQSLAMPVVAVTFIAFVFAVILALVVDSMGGSPFFSRRSAPSMAR